MISTLSKKYNFEMTYDSQEVFRILLKAWSNPVTKVNIAGYLDKFSGDHPEFLVLAATILDNEVSFNVVFDKQLANEISSLTLAIDTVIAEADYIFVTKTADLCSVIEMVKCGTLVDPHKSAVLFVSDNGEAIHKMKFSGPGINDSILDDLSEVAQQLIKLRDAQNYEYPLGIDLLFVNSKGSIFAIPRHIKAEVI